MALPLTNQTSYLVVSQVGASAYVPEVNVTEMDRRTIVRDIANRQYEGVVQVLEINVVAGTCKDVMGEIAREVMTFWADEGDPIDDDKFEWVELHVSRQAALSFRRAA